MRFLKRLLVAVYIYMGLFGIACFVGWCATGSEPSALIAGMCTAAGIESIVGGMMKIREIRAENKRADKLQSESGSIPSENLPPKSGESIDIP